MTPNTKAISTKPPTRGSFTLNRSLLFSLLPLFIGLVILIGLILFLSRRPDLHPDLFFEDKSNFIDFEKYPQPYLGIFTNIGLIFWFVGAGFAFLAGTLSLQKHGLTRYTAFLFSIVGMGLYLGFDDFLMFHEHLFEVYLHLHEGAVFGIYTVFGLLFVGLFHKEVRRSQFGYFLLFFVLFLFSVVVDGLRPDVPMFQSNPTLVVLEEGPKLLGLIAFAVYCFRLSYAAIQAESSHLNSAV